MSDAVNTELERSSQFGTGGDATGVHLIGGHLAVVVEVQDEASLERRDFGMVDDDIEQDPVLLDAQTSVVIDREIPQWVRLRQGGHDEQRDETEGTGHHLTPASDPPRHWSSARTALANATANGSKLGSRSSASLSRLAACRRSPSASAIIPA